LIPRFFFRRTNNFNISSIIKINIGIDIFKDPITDDGTKKSLKGLIMVDENHEVHTQCSWEEEETGILHTIYEDGKFYNENTLTQIRGKIDQLVNIRSSVEA
jgi:hypothetical protein